MRPGAAQCVCKEQLSTMRGVALPLASRVCLCVRVCVCGESGDEFANSEMCLTVHLPTPRHSPAPCTLLHIAECGSWISTTMGEPTKAQTAEVFKRLRHHAANKVRNEVAMS